MIHNPHININQLYVVVVVVVVVIGVGVGAVVPTKCTMYIEKNLYRHDLLHLLAKHVAIFKEMKYSHVLLNDRDTF